MRLEEFLEIVKKDLELKNIQEAERMVRVVVGALKSGLPEDKQVLISKALPPELSERWVEVVPLSGDIADRAEMSLEGEPPCEEHGTPTITDG